MNSSLINDSRATGLVNRVREDISHLREDVSHLLSHTRHQTLPNGARELAGQAKQQLAAGGAYAATRLRNLRNNPPRQSAGWIGGAVFVGLLAVGAYALTHNHNGHQAEATADTENDEPRGEINC